MIEYTVEEAAAKKGIRPRTIRQHIQNHDMISKGLARRVGVRLILISEAGMRYIMNIPGPGNPYFSISKKQAIS